MKRRSFLKSMAAAAAVAVAPVLLNKPKLELVSEGGEYGASMVAQLDPLQQEINGNVSMTIRRILKDDARERIDEVIHGTLVDNGVNQVAAATDWESGAQVGTSDMPYEGVRRSFRFREEEDVTEVGIAGGGKYQRIELDRPITVTEDEELEITYEYRLA